MLKKLPAVLQEDFDGLSYLSCHLGGGCSCKIVLRTSKCSSIASYTKEAAMMESSSSIIGMSR